jgi:hypothetical protein
MFIQVIQGQVADARAVKGALELWQRYVAPGAHGWLGSTVGVTDDGRLIGVVRFSTPDKARRNDHRQEQIRGWANFSRLFTAGPTLSDSDDVALDLVGDPDQAGFVQIIRGRVTNPERARELMTQGSTDRAAFRPDILGSIHALRPDGGYTMCTYFTSEAEAREGERKEPPPALKAQMDEMSDLLTGPPEFFDLKQPWLMSPR